MGCSPTVEMEFLFYDILGKLRNLRNYIEVLTLGYFSEVSNW